MKTISTSLSAMGAAACSFAALCASTAMASPLGIAGDFNAFIFGDVNYQNTDFEGRLAVGGNVNFMNMGVGSQLPNSNGSLDHMIVGGNVDWTNGQVFGGNLRHGGAASLNGVGLPNGASIQGSAPFSFASEQNSLQQSSMLWSSLTDTGTATNDFGAVSLTGTEAGLNVFNISGAWLAGANGLTIAAPAGSTVLINVDGANAQMQNFGFFLNNGIQDTNILFNFYEATSLNMSGIGIKGSILAPWADVNFANGQMDGTLIANSLVGSGELHHRLFVGEIPLIPAPAAGLALFGLLGLTSRRRRS